MNSSRSYLVNALIDWIVDNGCTPHIVLDAGCEGVNVPMEFVRDNRLVLNVGGTAVRNFKLDPEGLEFDARFAGTSRHISCPVGAIVGIYARENGEGMAFNAQDVKKRSPGNQTERSPGDQTESDDETSKTAAHLRLVKE